MMCGVEEHEQQPHRPRKLIEAPLPLAAMNAAGRAEKAVPRKGLPATMHIWWSRKPTGLARAVLFASLVDDPDDRPDLWPELGQRRAERQRRLDLVADLAHWDCPPERLDEARALVAELQAPPVIDPFCGGGTIPLEATRLGLDTVANDLNPVASLLTTSLVELPAAVAGVGPVHPRSGSLPTPGPSACAGSSAAVLATDIALYGRDLLADVAARIGHHYPTVTLADGAVSPPVAYLWARTATCVNPRCRCALPLLSTWWLSKHPKRQWHVLPRVQPAASGKGGAPRVELEVRPGPPPADLPPLKVGTGAHYRCPACGTVTRADDLREQSRGRQLSLRLVAVQAFAHPDRPANRTGRTWLPPDTAQCDAAAASWPEARLFPLPDVDLPLVTGNMASFGITTVEDMLTERQRLLMVTMDDALAALRPEVEKAATAQLGEADELPLRAGGRGSTAYAEAVTTYLALATSRMANRVSTMTVLNRSNGSVEQSFVQPGFAFYGEFPEANPFSGSTGSFLNALDHVTQAVAALPTNDRRAEVSCRSASDTLDKLAEAGRTGVVCTDPPYYDMLDYAALSNLFYPWLRAALEDIWPDWTGWLLAPDDEQIVSNPNRFDRDPERAYQHFAQRLRTTLSAIRPVQSPEFPLTLYYGYASTRSGPTGGAAWEALLSALVDSGFQVTSTWPLRTERPEGVKSGSNALASSIVLACRPRPPDAATATRAELEQRLRATLSVAVREFREASLAPVDLTQSALGPGMAVFSSYRQVRDGSTVADTRGSAGMGTDEDTDGEQLSVRTALELIQQVLADTVAEPLTRLDAPTRWAAMWLERHGTDAGSRAEADRQAQMYGTTLEDLLRAGVALPVNVARHGHGPGAWVSGVRVAFRADDGNEATLRSATTWAVTVGTRHRLAADSLDAAAAWLADAPAQQVSGAPALAYWLHMACQRRRWRAEAAGYNDLVRSWPQLSGRNVDRT